MHLHGELIAYRDETCINRLLLKNITDQNNLQTLPTLMYKIKNDLCTWLVKEIFPTSELPN